MRKPAHDKAVFTNNLLAIDAQVLPLFVRTAGYGEPPGNQRSRIAGPAFHDGNPRQIDVIAAENLFLAGCIAQPFGGHIQHLLKLRNFAEQVTEAFRRLRLF